MSSGMPVCGKARKLAAVSGMCGMLARIVGLGAPRSTYARLVRTGGFRQVH